VAHGQRHHDDCCAHDEQPSRCDLPAPELTAPLVRP
jgi:hypothetical protein